LETCRQRRARRKGVAKSLNPWKAATESDIDAAFALPIVPNGTLPAALLVVVADPFFFQQAGAKSSWRLAGQRPWRAAILSASAEFAEAGGRDHYGNQDPRLPGSTDRHFTSKIPQWRPSPPDLLSSPGLAGPPRFRAGRQSQHGQGAPSAVPAGRSLPPARRRGHRMRPAEFQVTLFGAAATNLSGLEPLICGGDRPGLYRLWVFWRRIRRAERRQFGCLVCAGLRRAPVMSRAETCKRNTARSDGRPNRFPDLAAEMVRPASFDLIVAPRNAGLPRRPGGYRNGPIGHGGRSPSAWRFGVVASLAHPGGNVHRASKCVFFFFLCERVAGQARPNC